MLGHPPTYGSQYPGHNMALTLQPAPGALTSCGPRNPTSQGRQAHRLESLLNRCGRHAVTPPGPGADRQAHRGPAEQDRIQRKLQARSESCRRGGSRSKRAKRGCLWTKIGPRGRAVRESRKRLRAGPCRPPTDISRADPYDGPQPPHGRTSGFLNNSCCPFQMGASLVAPIRPVRSARLCC